MIDLIKIYVVHYSKLKQRKTYFENKMIQNIEFNFITELNLESKAKKKYSTKVDKINMKYILSAIHLGHLTNILKSRYISKFILIIIASLIYLEFRYLKNCNLLNSIFFRKNIFTKKIKEVNLMHAKALNKAARNSEHCIIFEDDSIFESDLLVYNIQRFKDFIGKDTSTVIFFTKPSTRLNNSLEEFFQFNPNYIRVVPPISRSAGAYILHRKLAIRLANFINSTSIELPIDLLMNYWFARNKIKVFWQRKPIITEGSGNVYKSSLR